MYRELPVWRSLMYVPVNVEKYVDKAHTRGADCIQLDLEDSVPAVTLGPAAEFLPTEDAELPEGRPPGLDHALAAGRDGDPARCRDQPDLLGIGGAFPFFIGRPGGRDLQHLDLELPRQDLLPHDAQLHLGQTIAHAAVHAEPEGDRERVRAYRPEAGRDHGPLFPGRLAVH